MSAQATAQGYAHPDVERSRRRAADIRVFLAARFPFGQITGALRAQLEAEMARCEDDVAAYEAWLAEEARQIVESGMQRPFDGGRRYYDFATRRTVTGAEAERIAAARDGGAGDGASEERIGHADHASGVPAVAFLRAIRERDGRCGGGGRRR